MSPLDDIWEEPIIESAPAIPRGDGGTRSSKPARASLFLSDSEDEDAHGSRAPPEPPRGDNISQAPGADRLDAMFAGVDDDDDPFELEPALDVEKIKRQADARLAANSGNKSAGPSMTPVTLTEGNHSMQDKDNKDEKGPKSKRTVPKLDEERLLGQDGFPRLIKDCKNFKISGKGHEVGDLERLFRIYHAWSHKMYPKFQFRDTVDRVEKLCRSRRMGVNLRAWRDEAHGVRPDLRPEDEERGDGRDNEDAASSPASSRPSTPVTRPGSAASTVPSVPSSATGASDDDAMDIDALLREEEEIERAFNRTGKGGAGYKPSDVTDGDALWAAADGISDNVPGADVMRTLTADAAGEADDDDMWNMVDEMDAQTSGRTKTNDSAHGSGSGRPEHGSPPGQGRSTIAAAATSLAAPSGQPTIGEDWDDMYA